MEALLTLSRTRGYFLRREAVAFGVDDRWLHRAVRQGALVRIRHGAYCHRTAWTTLSPEGRHLARAMASYDLASNAVCLSHFSALAAYGCPLWNVDLDGVHLTRLDGGSSRIEAGVTHHRGERLRNHEVVERDRRRVTAATRSTIDGLSLMTIESGMVAGDWMLHHGLTNQADLWRLKTHINTSPGTKHLELTVRLLDGRSESPGESRCRYLFWLMGLPCPELQWAVKNRHGRVIAVVDFAWPELGIYGEFDGKVKYGRLLKPNQGPGDVVFNEKRREDTVRRLTGGTMVRWTWPEIDPDSEPSRQLESLIRGAP